MGKLDKYLSSAEIERIEAKIRAVEAKTSAELRVVMTRSSWLGLEWKARRLFRRLGMERTAARNGVLILVDVRDRELLVHGDEGIDAKVPEEFWEELVAAMIATVQEAGLAESLALGVHRAGEMLQSVFPARVDEENELDDALLYVP